jgi:hypothetical protein
MLMINPQHAESFLQAHFVWETRSGLKLFLHEERLIVRDSLTCLWALASDTNSPV